MELFGRYINDLSNVIHSSFASILIEGESIDGSLYIYTNFQSKHVHYNRCYDVERDDVIHS